MSETLVEIRWSKKISPLLQEQKYQIFAPFEASTYLCWALYTLILSFWGHFLLNCPGLLLSNRPGFPEVWEPLNFCKFQRWILSDGKEICIIYVMIGCLLVGKTLGLLDNTSQISMQIFVPTSWEWVTIISVKVIYMSGYTQSLSVKMSFLKTHC